MIGVFRLNQALWGEDMDPGQQKFHDFLMSMVLPGNETAAEGILTQAFAQQDAGSFSSDQIDSVVAQLTPLVNPNSVSELQGAAARMKEMATHAPGDHPWGPAGDHPHGPGDHMHGPGDGDHHHWGGPDGGQPDGAGQVGRAAPGAPAAGFTSAPGTPGSIPSAA